MRIEILGTPFNGLGSPPNTENPAQGLRLGRLVPLLESKGHSVTDLGDLSGFQFQELRDPETGIKDLDLWVGLSNSLSRSIFNSSSFISVVLTEDASNPALSLRSNVYSPNSLESLTAESSINSRLDFVARFSVTCWKAM